MPSTDTLAELVDLYPTLASLANLPDPKNIGEALNGTDLKPVFQDPVGGAGIKRAAYSQFAKVNDTSVNPRFLRNETKLMGYSVRVDSWRYTCWFAFDKVNIRPELDNILGRELYDHAGDTGLYLDFGGENRNLANSPSHQDVVEELHKLLLDYIQLR